MDLIRRLPPLLLLALVACNATAEPEPEPEPEPTCDATAPVCAGSGPNSGCDAGFSCNDTCTCVADAPVCDSTAPVCAGNGPNSGCADGFLCDTSCACVEEVCQADAPVCEGNGPNDGCDEGFVCNAGCACETAPPPPPTDRLARPSRSTPVDINNDDSVVAMVNTDGGSVSFFNATPEQESRIARVESSATTNAEPMSVVIHPNGTTAFVANRAAGSVARIIDIGTAGATRDAELELGGEPIGLALTPSGRTLWVTNWVSGTVTVVNTETMQTLRTIELGRNPYAIAITNDGDDEDEDEKALVTQFYAERRAGVTDEATDDGAQGIVHVIEVGANTEKSQIVLAPIADCFTAPINGEAVTTGCFPNQLNGITIHRAFDRTWAYVTSVAASPAGPVQFNHNVQAVVSVIDVDAEAEVAGQSTNLNSLVKDQVDNDGDETVGRRFLSVPNGIAFVNRDDLAIGYVTAAGSDIMVRVVFNEDGTVEIGAATALNIVVGQNPQGLVVRHGTTGAGAYTANLISRDLSVVSFRDQATVNTVESTATPTPGSDEHTVWRGKRFFNTGTGIWSREGWGSCQGCHPMGLTDNITWSFAAGPRQSISLDGQYASDDPSDMRALNWTAIFDETTDFELNTRGVSGGSGAIRNGEGPVASPAGPPFASLTMEDGQTVENHQALNGSLTFVARERGVCSNEGTCVDWDLIDRYIQTVRSPNAKPAAQAQIDQGRAVFADAGCNKCHAGAKWTVSRTFYTPEAFEGALPGRTFEADAAFQTAMDPSALVGLPLDVNVDATLVAGDDSDGGAPALKRQACNIRNVQTFGVEGGADEVRANGTPAQGRNGFNPPSLLGLSTGAPYLHHGGATDLDDLLDARFAAHTTAGNPNFAPTAAERDALKAFLLSIDEATAPFAIDNGTVLCPTP